MDALANPGFQRALLIGLAAAAGIGVAMLAGAFASARRALSARGHVLRKRVGAIGLFIAVAAGAGLVVLATPVEPAPGAAVAPAPEDSEDVSTVRRFSSARPPALALDAPDGWALALDAKGRKLTASGASARLMISTAILAEAVDVEALLARMADTQRTLGFEVGPTFSDHIGGLAAAGFLSTGPARSVCTWMVRRDTHLATSVICTADGKTSAREACRGVLANIRWRTPERR